MSTTNIGIYKITHVPSGKLYIGQSVNIKRRWWTHCARSSECVKLRNALQKYGKDQFVLTIIEQPNGVTNVADWLLEREQHYLDLLQPFGDMGYNICTIATPGSDNKGKPKTGKSAAGENHFNNEPVCAYDINGEVVQEYFSVRHAATTLGINKAGIFACLAGRARTAKGFFWARKGYSPIIREKISIAGQVRTPETRQKMSVSARARNTHRGKPAHNRRSVIATKDGVVYYEFDSLKQAAKHFGLYSSAGIFSAIKYKHKSRGYYWSYKESL